MAILIFRGEAFDLSYSELRNLRDDADYLLGSPEFDAEYVVAVKPQPVRTRRSKISPKKRFAVLERDGHRCRYCGVPADRAGELVLDHVRSLRDGGTNHIDNLAAACWECNAGKGGRSL